MEPETYEVSGGIVVDSEGAGIQGVSVQFFKDEEPLEDVTTDEAGGNGLKTG